MRGSTAERTSKTMKTNTEATQNEATAAAVAEQGANAAPEQAAATKTATSKKGAPKGQKAAKKAAAKKEAKPASKKTAKAAPKKQATAKEKAPSKKAAKPEKAQPREGSKKAIVLDMLRCADGATLKNIMDATAWQAHSVRGFISGALGKKMGLKVESVKRENGDRAYRIGPEEVEV